MPSEHFTIKGVLRDFGVKTESELFKKLSEEWNIMTCPHCGYKFDLIDCNSINRVFCRKCGQPL